MGRIEVDNENFVSVRKSQHKKNVTVSTFFWRRMQVAEIYNKNNRISFLIDTDSTISTIQATSRNTSRNPDGKVLDINFVSDCNNTWCFTKTYLRFSVIGIDFLTAHKLIVDSYNCCLIDKNHNCVILLFSAHSVPLKICCILSQKSEFHRVLSKYPKILNFPRRYQRKAHGFEHAICTNNKMVRSKLRRIFPGIQKIIDSQIIERLTNRWHYFKK